MTEERKRFIDEHDVIYYVGARRMRTVFCRYCGCSKRIDVLETHCLSKHKSPKAALKEGEEPIEPVNSNWKEIIDDLQHAVPIPVMTRRVTTEAIKINQDPKTSFDSTSATTVIQVSEQSDGAKRDPGWNALSRLSFKSK